MHRSFLFAVLIGFFGGICLAEVWRPTTMLLGVMIVAGFLATSSKRSRLIGLLLVGLSLGAWRWTMVTEIKPNSVAQLVNQTVTISGDILELPTHDSQQVVVLSNLGVGTQPWSGKLQAYVPPWPQYHLGQRLTVRCSPVAFSPAQHWRQWSHGVEARCFKAEVTKLSTSASSFRLRLGRIESGMVEFIHRSFNEPQASLLAGIILGSQSGMPEELTQAFQATGTTHIVALSGFNVTIIVSSVMVVFVRLIGRRSAWIPGLLLVIVFVVMSGASASVVRAAIMAVIVQLAMFLGRPIHPARLLSYTALMMLWQNPLILLHDLGFQLSFLATIGLMFLSKPMATVLTRIPETVGLRENLATTLSAIIATEPLLLWRFGRLSLIAPLVNSIVLPLIPLAMGLGTLSLIGLAAPFLTVPVVALTDVVLRIVLICITTGAHLPWSMVHLSFILTALSGALFALVAVRLIRHDHAQETHPA